MNADEAMLMLCGQFAGLLHELDDEIIAQMTTRLAATPGFSYTHVLEAVLEFKRRINPDAAPPTEKELETMMRNLIMDCDAVGALLLILHKGKRAEVVGGFQGTEEQTTFEAEGGLPGMLRRLADEIESGSGMPLGDHGTFYKAP